MYALRIAQNGLLMLQIVHFLFSMPVVYRPHPLFSMLMRLRMLNLSVGKGHQVMKQLYLNTALQSARGMCSTEL